jgi:hypothetical protein
MQAFWAKHEVGAHMMSQIRQDQSQTQEQMQQALTIPTAKSIKKVKMFLKPI